MRLIDADKLKDTFINPLLFTTEKGFYCYTIDEVRNAETVNAIPIPENATNGDMIKAIFPNVKTWDESEGALCVEFKTLNQIKIFPKYWWNAPYEKEVEE